MFTTQNTNGLTVADLTSMNSALSELMDAGYTRVEAGAIVFENWSSKGNTVASLATVH